MFKQCIVPLISLFLFLGCSQNYATLPVSDIVNLAKEGDPSAQRELASFYEKGKHFKKDYYESYDWYLLSAKSGDVESQSKVGIFSLLSKGTLANYDEAFFWLEKSSNQGNINSMYYLAKIYLEGKGRDRDTDKALYWLKKSSQKNEAKSQATLARLYINGRLVPKDAKKALALYTLSAKSGNIAAQNNLAILYHLGKDVKQDLDKATYWYSKSIEQGNKAAEYTLALIFKFQKKYIEAYTLLKSSAESNHVESMKELAKFYKLGLGVKKNNLSSLHWYKQAALANDSYSQFIIGSHLVIGRDLKQNLKLGTTFLYKSAKQNNANAQNQLGLLSYSGIGVKKDYRKSLKWYKLAIKNGNKQAICNMILPSLKIYNTKVNREILKKRAIDSYKETKNKFCKKILMSGIL